MARSLYVLRHAKAEELAPGQGDHARVLKRRGVKAARLVGRALTSLGEAPDLVLSSDAARAKETAERAREAGGWSAPIELAPSIYDAGAESLLRTVQGVDERVQRLLLVGHQPGLSLLIAQLVGSEPAFPTAALARIDLGELRWRDVAPKSGQLAWIATTEVLAALRPADD